MRISTRGRYALRAMVDLALHTDEGPVSRCDIVARQEISADYVAQLFRRLRAAGLVEGVKGPGGGYTLARDAAEIPVGDVVRAVEGPIAVVHCAIPSGEPSCNRMDRCAAYLLWKRLLEAMADFLDSITLKDLCDQARQLAQAIVITDTPDAQPLLPVTGGDIEEVPVMLKSLLVQADALRGRYLVIRLRGKEGSLCQKRQQEVDRVNKRKGGIR